jgi:TruD family tRNA pseudouridine synthase
MKTTIVMVVSNNTKLEGVLTTQPETQSAAVASVHPSLRRHYSTIGIDDVFVCMHPIRYDSERSADQWILPSEYLSPHVTPSLFPFSIEDDSCDTASSTVDISITQRVLGDEIIGNIKCHPEDFIVHEIATVLGQTQIADVDDNTIQAIKARHTNFESMQQTHTPYAQQAKSIHDEPECTPTSNTKAKQTKTTTKLEVATSNDPPKYQLEAILQEHLFIYKRDDSDDNDEITNECRSSPSNGQNIMLQLQAIEDRAIQRIQAIHSDYKYDTISETLPPMSLPPYSIRDVVSVTLSFPKSNSMDQYKQMKTQIHDCFRRAFPLLIAEGCNKKTTDSNVTQPINHGDDTKDDANHYYYAIRILIDTTLDELIPYLFAPTEDLSPLYQYAKAGYEASKLQKGKGYRNYNRNCSSTNEDGPILRLIPTLPRTYRRPIHQMIEQKYNNLLGTETIKEYPLLLPQSNPIPDTKDATPTLPAVSTTTAIRISWTKLAARRVSKKRHREESASVESHSKGSNPPFQSGLSKILCVVRKRQREHLGMINTISAILKCPSSDIGFAGMKDLQGITYQFGTINSHAVQRLQQHDNLNDILLQRGIQVVPLFTVPEPLNKGDLIGNSFEIIVRNVRRVQLEFDKSANSTTAAAFPVKESLVPVDDNHLQFMMNRVQQNGFINFYGEQRVGDPGHVSVVGVRAFDIGRAMLQQKYYDAIDLLITGRRLINGIEMIGNDVELFRRVWKETNGDPIATMKALPTCKNSVPRERAVLKGLVRYGIEQPLTALRCLQRNERLFFINAVRRDLKWYIFALSSHLAHDSRSFRPFQYQSYVWNMMATERMKLFGNQVVAGDLIVSADSNNKPVLVTETDLVNKVETGVFTMANVVLPMPGYDTIYPCNKIGELYQDFLRKEDVQFDKNSLNDESKTRGSYRRVITYVENFSYHRLSHDSPSGDVNVKLKFSLSKGSYATMFLRELMLKTIARDMPEYTLHDSVA